MAVMHIYFNFTQPLFIQALMGIKGLYDAKPVSIHLLGNLPVGDLRRPFKVASFFGRESRFFLPLFFSAWFLLSTFTGHVYVKCEKNLPWRRCRPG